MSGVRHHGARQLGALFLLALLACPIALSGHTHQSDDIGTSRASCTLCAATAHAPALAPPAAPQFVLLEQGAIGAWLGLTPPALGELRSARPRAPPAGPATLIA